MTPETFQVLRAINDRFYRQHADTFDRTRDRGWPGWLPIVELFQRGDEPLEVLDLACGNGRFAQYLAAHSERDFAYFGVDSSEPLLEAARQRCSSLEAPCSFRRVDLFSENWTVSPPLEQHHFGAVVAFGLLHHVPGFSARRQLLEHSLDLVTEGGLLCISCWQLEGDPRFDRRRLRWQDHLELLDAETESQLESMLEEHDHLLSWGGDPTAIRYCHHTTDEEAERLASGLPADLVDRYRSDGAGDRQNLYLVLRRSPPTVERPERV